MIFLSLLACFVALYCGLQASRDFARKSYRMAAWGLVCALLLLAMAVLFYGAKIDLGTVAVRVVRSE